jgi:hypothetical protein
MLLNSEMIRQALEGGEDGPFSGTAPLGAQMKAWTLLTKRAQAKSPAEIEQADREIDALCAEYAELDQEGDDRMTTVRRHELRKSLREYGALCDRFTKAGPLLKPVLAQRILALEPKIAAMERAIRAREAA